MTEPAAAADAPVGGLALRRIPVVRRLGAASLVSTIGNGMTMTLSALFFTRIVGLPAGQVGLGLTVAGLLGVIASVRSGPIVDRYGARTVFTWVLIGSALCSSALGLLDSFWPFLVLMCAATLFDRAGSTTRAALYAEALPPELRTPARALLRSITNVGIGIGATSAALVLHFDSRTAYATAFVIDGLTFLAAAVILRGLPTQARVPRSEQVRGPNPALRDRPYLAVTALNSLLMLQFTVIEIGVPLWIANHTDAPRVLVSVVLVLNTVLVVLFQVRAARFVTGVAAAGRVARLGGLLLAASMVLFGVCAGLPGWVAALILVGASVVEVLGEVATSAAGWELGYALADEQFNGSYQGVFNGGWSAMTMLGPVIVTSTALHFGFGGWVFLAVVFAASGAALGPVARWAASTRGVALAPAGASVGQAQ